MRLSRLLGALGAALACMGAWAAAPEGTWQFERSVDYFGRTVPNQPPKFTTIVFRNSEVSLSDACVARFSVDDYLFPQVFQPMSRQGVTEKQLDSFLLKNFDLSLSMTKEVYPLASRPANCARPIMEFFVVNDRVLIPAGATFYSFVKASPAL